MPNFVNNTITINGEVQIAAAIAKTQLVITRVQIGAGIANVALPSLTALSVPIMNLTPQPPQVSANNLQLGEVVVMAILDSANVTSTFQLTELGVFATSGGGPEQLIAYCQCSSPYDTIAPGSGSNRLILNLQVPIVVGVGASVSITVQAGNPVYIPPVVAGPGIVVDAPTDASGRVIEWIVSTPQITQSTTLYVANEYTQNVAPYFSTLQNAINYLNGFSIASGVEVYINLAAETFNINTTVTLAHVNSSQIIIQGSPNPAITFNGIGAITGSAGNWKVQLLNVSSTANIQAGTWLDIWSVSFNWMCPLIGGCFQVVSVSGSTVTIQTYYYAANWPNMAGTTGNMTPLTTILNVTSSLGVAGIILNKGIGLLQYIAIVNPGGLSVNYPASGILTLQDAATFRYLGLFGFRGSQSSAAGIYVTSGAVGICQCCGSSFNDHGYIASNGTLIYSGCCSSHNLSRGIWGDTNASVQITPGIYNTANYIGGNREKGLLLSNSTSCLILLTYVNGQVWTQPLMTSYNNGEGVFLMNQSRTAFAVPNAVFYAAYNVNYDVAAIVLSAVAGSALIQGTRIFNGTPGVLTSDGCIFS